MLRCCQQILRLSNNCGMGVPIPRRPLDMAMRCVSHAPKFGLWDMSCNYTGTADFTGVSDSTIHTPGHPTYNSSIPMPDAEGQSLGASASSSCDSAPPTSRAIPVDQLSALEAKLPQVQLSPPVLSHSPAILDETVQSLRHQAHSISTTGSISSSDLPAHPVNSVMPTQCGGLSRAVERIQRLVSDVDSDSLRLVDAAALVSAFHDFGPQLLRVLDVKHCSELLCLFGTLSDEGDPHGNGSQCKVQTQGAFCERGYWEEVILVARGMEEKGYAFGDRENYWLMRAYLERWKTSGITALRDLARAHYARINREGQTEPHVLIPYLDAFLFTPSTPCFYAALDILCNALAEQTDPNRQFIGLLWKVILTKGDTLSSSYKSRIVDLLLGRLVQRGHLVRDPASTTVEDFATAFGASFLPSYQEADLLAPVSSWIGDRVRKSFAKDLPTKERFNNLTLLAAWLFPQERLSFSMLRMASSSLEWRVVISLAILCRSLTNQAQACPEPGELRNIARLLSCLWERHAVVERPKGVDRAVVVAILRVAVQVEDEVLLDWSMDYVLSRRLWFSPQSNEHETTQVEQLLGAFADGIFAHNNRAWATLPSFLMDLSHSPPQRNRYLRSVLGRLANRDVELAHQFYTKCLSHHTPIFLEASVYLAQRLAVRHKWDDVIPFLRDQRSSDTQLEQLLTTVLRIFRNDRQDSMLPILAKTVGDVLSRLYSNTHIPDRLKFPIRYFLPVMITSRQAQQVVQLLEVFAKENPTLLTPRLLLRIIHTLMRHRQHGLAVKTLELASNLFKAKPWVISQLRRKTLLALIRAGAVKLASRVGSGSPPLPTQTALDRLLRLSARRRSRSLKLSLARLVSVVMASRAHGPTIISAVMVLVQNRCFALAKQLIERSYKHLKPQDLTVIGNICLHSPLRHWNVRNKSLVRHVLRTKDFLVKRYGFVPDRTTVNIVIKAMLRWRVFVDSRMIKCLFDHLVRNGYPASERWHTAHGVPFGTPLGEVTLDLSKIRQNMSFKRHVQPLYRMFIKELFLRKDARAASRIIGILKEVEVLAKEQKELREKVRRIGVMKKQRERALLEK